MEFVVIWLLCGLVAGIIGSSKGAGCSGFALGFLLGPFGILIAIFMKGDRKACPQCKEMVKKDAAVCPHCQREIAEQARIGEEERKKIDEEEKVRLEAQERLKREAKPKSNGAFYGVLSVVGVVVLLVIILNLPKGKTRSEPAPAGSTSGTPTSTPSNSLRNKTTSPAVDTLQLKHPDWSLNVCRGIEKHGVWSEQDDGSWHGMTHEQLTASWGNPSHVKHVHTYVSFIEQNSDEQWVYDNKPWIIADDGRATFYFRGGVLVGWSGIAFEKILYMNAQQ
jgi:hypothetical protein